MAEQLWFPIGSLSSALSSEGQQRGHLSGSGEAMRLLRRAQALVSDPSSNADPATYPHKLLHLSEPQFPYL